MQAKGRWGLMGIDLRAYFESLGWWSKSAGGSTATAMDTRFKMTHMQRCLKEKGRFHTRWKVRTIVIKIVNLKNLQWQVKEMELKARSQHQRRSPEGLSYDDDSGNGYTGRSSHQSHSQLSRNRLDITNERRGWVPKRRHEYHDLSIKEERPITFFRANRTHRDTETLHSLAVHLLEWQDGFGGAHKPFYPTYGSLFSERRVTMQGVPFQSPWQ